MRADLTQELIAWRHEPAYQQLVEVLQPVGAREHRECFHAGAGAGLRQHRQLGASAARIHRGLAVKQRQQNP